MSAFNTTFGIYTHGSPPRNASLVCFNYSKGMHSKGIFHGQNPIGYVYPLFLVQFILISLVSRAVYFILRPLRQPKFVCNVLAGVILGPSVLGRNKAFMEVFFPENEKIVIDTMVVLGTAYFIFITAVKMDTSMLIKTAPGAWTIGLSGFFGTLVSNVATIAMLRGSIMKTPSLVVVYGMSSTLAVSYYSVIVRAVEEQDLLTSELGLLAMSSSLLSESIAWCLYGTTIVLTRWGSLSSLYPVMLLLFSIYVIRPILKLIIRKTPAGKPVSDIYIIAIVIWTMVMALFTDFIAGLTIPGALLMGLIVPDGPPLASTLVEKSELMIMEFFVPFFYIQVGYYTDINAIQDLRIFSLELLVVAAGSLGKMLGILLASLHLNIRLRNGILLGCIMNSKGVLDAINYRRFLLFQLIGNQTYAAFLLGNVLITAIITPLVKVFYKRHIRLHEFHPEKEQKRSLQFASESGELRVLCGIHNEESIHGIITLIEATNPNRRSPICIYAIHLVELVGRATPLLAPYKKNKNGFDPHNTEHMVRALMNYSKNSSGPISIQPFTILAPYKIMDNMVTNFVQDKKISLVIVPFLGNQETDHVKRTRARKFYMKVQDHAPCTVGILLDRGTKSGQGNNGFSYKAVVVFLGGPDDREALALAIRMGGNPNVSIKLVRIHFKKEHDDTNEVEKELDDLMVKEFKDRNVNNPCVTCREVVVNDGVEMMGVLRTIENHYDLIIVGKRPSDITESKQDIPEWLDYEELGMVGDFLASTDFCDGNMSVLVLKWHGHVEGDQFRSISVKSSYNGDHEISNHSFS